MAHGSPEPFPGFGVPSSPVINKIKVNPFWDVGAVCRKPERAPRMADAAPNDIEQRL